MKYALLLLAVLIGCDKKPDAQPTPPVDQPAPPKPEPKPEPEPEPEPTPVDELARLEAGDLWLAFAKEWDHHIETQTGMAFGRHAAEMTFAMVGSFFTGAMLEMQKAKLEKVKGLSPPVERPKHSVIESTPEGDACLLTIGHAVGSDQQRLHVDLARSGGRWWIKAVRMEGPKTPPLDLIRLVLKLNPNDIVTAPADHRWIEAPATVEQSASAYAEMNVRVRVKQSDLWLAGARRGIEMMKRYFAPETIVELEERLADAVEKGRARPASLACQKGPVTLEGDARAYFMLTTPISKDRMLLERVDLSKVGEAWLIERVREAAPCSFCRQTKLCPACKGSGEGKPGEPCALCKAAKHCIRCEGSGFAPRE